MTIVQLSRDDYKPTIARDGIVLVCCLAPSCGVCGGFTPVFAKVAQKYPEHTFATLDTLGEKVLTMSLHVTYVPALILYRDGIALFKKPGTFDEERLDDIVSQAEALDMNIVRADIIQSQDGATEPSPSR